MNGTQVEVLVRYLREHPGATSLEITKATDIVNVTGRVSDARKRPGIDIDCRKRKDGRDAYYLTEGESAPGMARITADDSPAQIERKVATAFAPITSMREAWDRVFGGDS